MPTIISASSGLPIIMSANNSLPTIISANTGGTLSAVISDEEYQQQQKCVVHATGTHNLCIASMLANDFHQLASIVYKKRASLRPSLLSRKSLSVR